MSLKIVVENSTGTETVECESDTQLSFSIRWTKAGKEYIISQGSFTHNPNYPTPTLSLIAPHPGIPLRVYDLDGKIILDTRAPKGT